MSFDHDEVDDAVDEMLFDHEMGSAAHSCDLYTDSLVEYSSDTEDVDDDSDGNEYSGNIPDLNAGFANDTEPAQCRISSSRASGKRGQVLQQIESIVGNVIDSLLCERNEAVISLPSSTETSKNVDINEARGSTEFSDSKIVSFPGSNAEEAWRFTVIFRLLELIHEAISSDTIMTKRDIYYRDPALFGSQTVVDRYVDVLSASFNVRRADLNVCAAAKGLIAGAITINSRDGTTIDVSTFAEPLLVMSMDEIMSVNVDAVDWILVIEKEATFQAITELKVWEDGKHHGIVITGKGYPDLSTRALLHFLTTPSPRNGFCSPATFGLVDFDPDGLAILSVYKHGSVALASERSSSVVPSIQRLGLTREHIRDTHSIHQSQGLLPMTDRDRKRARTLLDQEQLQEGGIEWSWRLDLQVMLMLDVKAELQILDAAHDGLENLLKDSLIHG